MPATIQEGSTGDDVRLAQYLLVRDLILVDNTQIDGVFGPKTKTAVVEFQQGAHLTADGIVGPLTWAALEQPHTVPPTLSQGSQGSVVQRLQEVYNEGRGQFAPDSDPVLATDGIYGPLTKGVTEAVQGANGITVDGVVGLQTWATRVHAANQMIAGVCGFA
jgi:peptidoglycan hydrolase-like protein with peptidoglycan-binding domain